MRVAIVVLNWNGAGYISTCLDSILKLDLRACKLDVIVVDNNSSDNSIDVIQRYANFTLIKNSHNLGYAEGNNVGIQHALHLGVDFVWIVNPDVRLHSDSLQALVAGAFSHPNSGIFTPKIYFAKGYEFHTDRYAHKDLGKVIWSAGGFIDWANLIASHRGVDEIDTGQFDLDMPCDFATGASIFIKSEVFKSIGLIDPKFYLYFEENDFCQRARKAGYAVTYIADSICWHANAQATGIGSSLQDYYISRNRMLFGLRWAPIRTQLALLRESCRIMLLGRPWQKRGILDFYLGRLERGSYK